MKNLNKNVFKSRTTLWERPGYLVRRLHQFHTGIFLKECKSYGITAVQYAVITVLLNRPNSDQVTIAREAGLDRTNVADVLGRLEARNIVGRKKNAKDRRTRLSHLTRKGEKIAREMEIASLTAQKKFMKGLSKEKQKQLMILMTELISANNEFNQVPSSRKK